MRVGSQVFRAFNRVLGALSLGYLGTFRSASKGLLGFIGPYV